MTEDGISPRVIPGMKNGIHHVTGVEHDEIGRPSEAAANRKAQMDKRMRKLENLHFRYTGLYRMHPMKKQIY